jgi:putative endonuclease
MSVNAGHDGEDLACKYLEDHDAQIIARNWRNRWCEIDIIASIDDGLRFVEVKYRRFTDFGSPAEYITYDKSNRLRRACLAWTQNYKYEGPYQIDVMSISGDLNNPVIDWLENAVID